MGEHVKSIPPRLSLALIEMGRNDSVVGTIGSVGIFAIAHEDYV